MDTKYALTKETILTVLISLRADRLRLQLQLAKTTHEGRQADLEEAIVRVDEALTEVQKTLNITQ